MQPDDIASTVSDASPAEPLTAEGGAEGQPLAPQTATTGEQPVGQVKTSADTLDYKSLYEEEKRRRAGLDRRLSRQQRGTRTESEEENLFTGDETLDSQVLQHPLTRKALDKLATYQLKEGVEEVLKNFPHVPKDLVKAIKANPRGFVNADTETVVDAINDIEDYLFNTFGESDTAKETAKEFPVAQSNTVATEPSEKAVEDMSADELSEKIDRGELKLTDLEDIVKKQKSIKEVKNTK